jgi:ketosteroid isomerase-like protein
MILTTGGTQTMTHTKPLDVVQDFIERIEARDMAALDIAALETTLAEAAFIEHPIALPGVNARFDGREAVMSYFRQTAQNFSSIAFVNKTFYEAGNFVFAEMSGDFITADGRPYRNRYLWRFEVVEGKFVSILEYTNPSIFAQTFGIPVTSQ